MITRSKRLKLGEWLLNHRWWWMALASLGIFIIEYIEYHPFDQGLSKNFIFEISYYGIILPITTGLALSGLAAIRSELAWSNYYQDLSGNLAIKLQNVHSEKELARIFVQFISVVMPLVGAVIYKYVQQSNTYEIIFSWFLRNESGLTNSAFECWAENCPLSSSVRENDVRMRPCLNPSMNPLANTTSCFCVPFIFSKTIVAGARFYLLRGSVPSENQARLMNEFTLVISSAINRIQLEELMKKREDLIQAESQRLARDVHDSLGHSLAYLRLMLDQISMESSQAGMNKLYKEVETLRDVAKDAYDQMRAVLISLTPNGVSDISNTLVNYADKISQRANFEIRTRYSGQPHKMGALVQRNIFYIFQEILTNIEKHAHARHVNVCVDWLEHYVEIEVNDDGVGFDPMLAIPNGHFGLNNIRERAVESNAQLIIESQPNSGTCIHLLIPYEVEK